MDNPWDESKITKRIGALIFFESGRFVHPDEVIQLRGAWDDGFKAGVEEGKQILDIQDAQLIKEAIENARQEGRKELWQLIQANIGNGFSSFGCHWSTFKTEPVENKLKEWE